MNETRCACPECSCVVDADSPVRDGKAYCCEACAEGHPPGKEHCREPACQCGDASVRAQLRESRVDNALEETFPASDPISP